jgi:AAA+ superfamily predicted ATPase
VTAPPGDAWALLPDLLLAREAIGMRARRGVPADAMVGLRVEHAEIEVLLAEFSGGTVFEGGDPASVGVGGATFDEQIADARHHFATAFATQPVLYSLAMSLDLDVGQAELLAFLCAVDLEPRRQRLLAYIQDDATAVRPRLHTVARVFGGGHSALDGLVPDSPLIRSGLVNVGSGRPWGSTEVHVHPLLGWAATGRLAIDPEVPAGWRLATTARSDEETGSEQMVLVWGRDQARRIEEAARHLPDGFALLGPIPVDDRAWAAVVRTATVCGFSVMVECGNRLTAEDRRWIEEAGHLSWALLSPHPLPVDDLPRRVHVEYPAPAAEVAADEYLETVGESLPLGHRITADQMRAVADRARNTEPGAALKRLAAGSMEVLARRITPRRTFDDLVVDDDVRAQLHELIDRYRHRDAVTGWGADPDVGVTALFAGPSGTGKTLSAEVVAGALGLELFKIDLSSVVSKWIGETEQNLEQIFAAAEATQQVLLFDEADALFGRRSEVSDARDRYANIEVAYLLQRLESYSGFVVLTTNLRKNMDEAFTRRMSAVIDFGVPGAAERTAIWRHAFGSAPLDGDVDLARLAEDLELTGGLIAAASVTAMHLAVAAGSGVTLEHIHHALRREMRKAGRLVPPVLEASP